MRYINNSIEFAKAEDAIWIAAIEAAKSTCKKSQRGVVIIDKHDEIIGVGYNKPTDERSCELCLDGKININKKELCSAIHAEQMALLNSDRDKLKNSRMYHIETKDKEPIYSEEPSCTLCSRLLVFSGIKEFVLYKKEGFVIYNTGEFNKLSYDYVFKNKL